jgi:methylenetetrahydrofolate dehydrogenase (NADP+)/methenyltetrahydrofolate cyclohydrolase
MESGGRIIDGKAIADGIRTDLQRLVKGLQERGQRVPTLAVVLVGADPGSEIYVRGKRQACEGVGMRSVFHHLPAATPEAALLALIADLNRDPAVDGILVQLPLPSHMRPRQVISAIDPDKDVDGFHPLNFGRLALEEPGFKPCTPVGVMRLLETIGFDPRGRLVTVVGWSNIVGKPLSLLLTAAGATTTVCHIETPDIAPLCRTADLLVVAAGHPGLITRDMVKPGAVVIDVGINRLPTGKLVGDVDFANVQPIASWITPVPKGVGPMTVAMLLENTWKAYEKHQQPAADD